jgi:hypothetical protein
MENEKILELRDKIVERGMQSMKDEMRKPIREGGIVGFEISKTLKTREEYEEKIKELREKTFKLFMATPFPTQKQTDEYWYYKSILLQVEFVYERLSVLWGNVPSLSAHAVIDINELMKEEEASA